MSKFWDSLEKKGKYATLIGMIIGFPAAILLTYLLYKNGDFKYIPFCIAFGIALLFFILPSSLSIAYKEFKFEVKD